MTDIDNMDFKEYSVYLVQNESELLNAWQSHGDTLHFGLAKLVIETATAE
ncbi:hypothetical protein [Methanococcoides alaskense]|uniref:Uncharacterized protein n=1 Tax=Methanococcoides alaskense TaxID=325778 RepID=A0AA90TX83_9EURY|nr:hypothetical protein [Methanococcoides alaskense]MDA0525439.1 hypothetical protein [Methanococcoides alaskense]MDR6221628.1 hypothetical protein [Methanococcoides alaskense]